jgi:hypothetical protein
LRQKGVLGRYGEAQPNKGIDRHTAHMTSCENARGLWAAGGSRRSFGELES